MNAPLWIPALVQSFQHEATWFWPRVWKGQRRANYHLINLHNATWTCNTVPLTSHSFFLSWWVNLILNQCCVACLLTYADLWLPVCLFCIVLTTKLGSVTNPHTMCFNNSRCTLFINQKAHCKLILAVSLYLTIYVCFDTLTVFNSKAHKYIMYLPFNSATQDKTLLDLCWATACNSFIFYFMRHFFLHGFTRWICNISLQITRGDMKI